MGKKRAVNKLVLIAALLLLVIIGLILVLFPTSEFKSKTILLDKKPTLIGNFIKNPDIIHSSYGWLSATPENLATESPIVLNVSSDWSGDALIWFDIDPVENRNGVAIMHPISQYKGRYIEQSLLLPEGNIYELNLGVTNAVNKIGTSEGNCADVGIKAMIISGGRTYKVFDEIVRNDGWYDYSIYLGDQFNGNYITARVESYAADNGCGFWNGEFAVIDYIDIVSK